MSNSVETICARVVNASACLPAVRDAGIDISLTAGLIGLIFYACVSTTAAVLSVIFYKTRNNPEENPRYKVIPNRRNLI